MIGHDAIKRITFEIEFGNEHPELDTPAEAEARLSMREEMQRAREAGVMLELTFDCGGD